MSKVRPHLWSFYQMQLTVKDVAGLLNISEKTVYRWIDERKLPGYRLSGQYRFNRAELLDWATSNRINVSPRIFEEPASHRRFGAWWKY